MISDALPRLDAKLQHAGFPPMSPWWATTLTDFYASGARQLVLRVGRRGGKSSSLCRVAVLEALYGEHHVPPGDVGIVGVVSVSRDEAAQRLRTIRAILDALRVKYRPVGDTIELAGRPIVFKVFTASVGGVVGGTWICALCDEVARWADTDTGANPAAEVLGSLRPTLATMPNAKLFLSSSPLGHLDAHARAFDLGDTSFQRAARATTWQANPTITEADTRALEPDERIWAREYAAIPQAATCAAFDAVSIDAAFRAAPEGMTPAQPVMVVDPSQGRDAWSWGIVRWLLPRRSHGFRVRREWVPTAQKWVESIARDIMTGEPIPDPDAPPEDTRAAVLQIVDLGGWTRRAGGVMPSAETIVGQLAQGARAHGVTNVVGDQFEAFTLGSLFGQRGLKYHALAWTNPAKSDAVETLRGWLRDRRAVFPVAADKLRTQLHAFQERVTPSGSITWAGKADDFVSLALMAARLEAEGQLPDAPFVARKRKPLPRNLFP